MEIMPLWDQLSNDISKLAIRFYKLAVVIQTWLPRWLYTDNLPFIQLYDNGFRNIDSVDIEERVISDQRKRNSGRSELNFAVESATAVEKSLFVFTESFSYLPQMEVKLLSLIKEHWTHCYRQNILMNNWTPSTQCLKKLIACYALVRLLVLPYLVGFFYRWTVYCHYLSSETYCSCVV